MKKIEGTNLQNELLIKGIITNIAYDEKKALATVTIKADKSAILEVLFNGDMAKAFNAGYNTGDTITLNAYALGVPYEKLKIVCTAILPNDFFEADAKSSFTLCGDVVAIKRQFDGLFTITVKSKIEDGRDSLIHLCLYAENAKELPFSEGSRVLFQCSAVGSFIETTDKRQPIVYELAFAVDSFKQNN